MTIAYVVDVHDRLDAVALALNEMGPVDVLIVGGDITNSGSPDVVEKAVSLWRPIAPRLLAVTGNMDSVAADARLANLGVSLDSRGVVIEDIGFCGVSAAPKSPLHLPYEITEEEIQRRLEEGYPAIAATRVKILCPHAPPHGACDRIHSGLHVGSTALRAFIEREQPDLVLCGHIHEARGKEKIGRTLVVNPGALMEGHWAAITVGDAIEVRMG